MIFADGDFVGSLSPSTEKCNSEQMTQFSVACWTILNISNYDDRGKCQSGAIAPAKGRDLEKMFLFKRLVFKNHVRTKAKSLHAF